MKKVSEHLGQIIVALAAIALLVTAVVVFRAPLGSFFGNVVAKTTSIGEEIMANMDDVDVTNLIGGNGSGGSGGSGESGGAGGTSALPASGVDATTREITDSWEQIQQAISEGVYTTRYKAGDTKTINMGSYGDVVMQIVAFDADTKIDGGTAAITWLSKDLIAEHTMNSTNTNAGGWEASAMRTWLRTEVYNTLPDEVKNAIVEVNKTYGDYNGGSYTTKTCSDKVWIPSLYEMFGPNSSTEGCEDTGVTYTSFFTNNASRMKRYSGSAAHWWLRSAGSSFSNTFRIAGNGSGYAGAVKTYGVALGFCM